MIKKVKDLLFLQNKINETFAFCASITNHDHWRKIIINGTTRIMTKQRKFRKCTIKKISVQFRSRTLRTHACIMINNSAVMPIILIIGLIDGPVVSLYGSPIVSPVTAA